MREVFISYKSNDPALGNNDETVANELCQALEAAGITCWMAPRDIPYGYEYDDCIADAIEACEEMVVVFSQYTLSSQYVYEEVRIAHEYGKHITRFRLDNTQLKGKGKGKWNLRLGSKHWINAIGDYRESIPKLLTELKRRLRIPETHTGFSEDNGNKATVIQPKQPKKQNEGNNTEIPPLEGKPNGQVEEDSQVTEMIPSIETFSIKGVSFNMVRVVGGKFIMGATEEQGTDAYNIEKPSHEVELSSYLIGETPVTQELWQAVMGKNPSKYIGDLKHPVERVSWDVCTNFIYHLNKLTGMHFRLPTEAEWEFAARGGNKSKGYKFAGSNDIDEVAWCEENSDKKTHPVAMKKANELGLFDMNGNVYEWCQDWYGNYANDKQIDPKGPYMGSYRSARGGCWMDNIRRCRVSYRDGYISSNKHSFLGLRLALNDKRK